MHLTTESQASGCRNRYNGDTDGDRDVDEQECGHFGQRFRRQLRY
ncbi:hypothetical protein [Stieleria maiorica]|nr:hypothetical protein [Stieleria maiorica]